MRFKLIKVAVLIEPRLHFRLFRFLLMSKIDLQSSFMSIWTNLRWNWQICQLIENWEQMGMHCCASISIPRCSDAAYVHQKRKIILHGELCCDMQNSIFAGFYQQDIKLIKVHSVEPPGESLIAFRVQRSAGMSTNDLLRKIGLLCPRILQNLFAFCFFMTVGQQCPMKMENDSSTLSCCQ